ncbi:aminotransferase class IV [Paenibacillus sp. 1P07SE]|uniref:aminotransferase class IV n=1 Tax=Paenibacillus sp. 1P07SE TaxID=3132209 RepID=UPI0039A65F02
MKVGRDGAVVDASEAVISVFDHGFLYGMGLFETFRTYGGRPYLLSRHLERLAAGCRELGIRFDWTEAGVAQWLQEVLAANGLADGYVRLTVTAGEEGLGLPAGDYDQPHALLLVKPLPELPDSLYVEGKQLWRLALPRNTPEGAGRHKSLHYMNNILAKRELMASAAAAGAEGLMLTREGWLAEGIVSNLFFRRGERLLTPALDTGILPGITRERVIALARELGMPVEEGKYTWSELLSADEVWLTNSIQELVPVTVLASQDGGAEVSGGRIGNWTQQLLSSYREETGGVIG